MSPVLDISRVVGRPLPTGRIVGFAAGKAAEKRAADAYVADDYDAAIAAFMEARRLGISTSLLHSGLGTAYMFTGRNREAIAEYKTCLRLAAGDPAEWASKVMANLIVLLDHQPETTLESALAARRDWWKVYGAPHRATWRPHGNDRDPERPLRIGYVSGDFKRHSAAAGFSPVVLRHTEGFRAVCYYNCKADDEVTTNFFEKEAAEFYRVHDLDSAALAEKIRQDRIDILVDLSGYSALHRLETFCRRPAPVQVTGWGYATGTGLPVMDGFFADAYTVPPELARRGYTEPILALPCIVPFAPMPYSDPVQPLPSLTSDWFTFGSFNRWNKMSESVLETWGRILAAVPNSRLLLKEKIYEREDIRRQVVAAMARQGVAAERIEFRPWTTHVDHLRAYHEVDLALDPFPHSGGITALEGLWQGVPPITLVGERVPERLSASFCSVLNLKAFIATSRQDYIDRAVGFATHCLPQLAEIRSTLQHRMAASPLCTGYVAAVETHYRDLWRSWCQRRAA